MFEFISNWKSPIKVQKISQITKFLDNFLIPNWGKKIRELKGARDAFEFVDRYAKENNIPLIGSFNPADEGLTESDFYDGPHVRKEIMDKIVERELF